MKKNPVIQKCTTLFLLLLLVFSPTFTSNASDGSNSPTLNEKIEFLRSIGTEESFLSSLTEERISNLYSSLYGKNVRYSGSKVTTVEIKEPTGERSTIPSSELELSVGTYDLYDANDVNNVIGVDVSVGYNWLSCPTFLLEDGMIFNWDSDLFYDDGFYAVGQFRMPPFPGVYVSYLLDRPGTAAPGGMGWSFPINRNGVSTGYPLMDSSILPSGGAQILLRPRHRITLDQDINSKMYLNYAHSTLIGSIGFSGPGGVSVSFSSTPRYEQAFSYTYH